MSYKVVEIQETDNFEMCQLFQRVFGKPISKINSLEIFSWLLFDNVYKKNYCKGLHNGSEFVGHWGFIPVDFKKGNKILKGSLSFYLISTQEVLGSSLLLWKKIKENLINDDVALSFTINNENSHLLLKNIGWKAESTPIVINIVNPFKLINDLINKKIGSRTLEKISKRIFFLADSFFSRVLALFHHKDKHVFEVKSFDEKYNELWEVMGKSIDYGINLDAKYMNWRYIRKPNNNYKILSYIDNDGAKAYLIYRTKKDFGTHIGYIMDIIADPKNIKVVNSLIQIAKKNLFQAGVTMISALSFKGNIFHSSLEHSGFFNPPEKFMPRKSYFSVNNFIDSEDDFDLDKWHISWGNHDNV